MHCVVVCVKEIGPKKNVYGTISLTVFQGHCTQGHMGHMIKHNMQPLKNSVSLR